MAFFVMIAWAFGSLFVLLTVIRDESGLSFLAVTNPLVAIASIGDPSPTNTWVSMGWPFAVFALLVGILLLALTESEVLAQIEGSHSPT